MCIADGVLRAKLDGELPAADLPALEAHLAACARCRGRAAEIAARAERVEAHLAALSPCAGELPESADAAFARFEARRRSAPEPRRWAPWRFAPAWGAAAAVALVAVLVASGPTRALAQRLLGLLRVRAVVVVPLDRDFFAEGKGKLLSRVLADSVTVTKEEEARQVPSREDAAAAAGFTVRLPALRQDAPRLWVEGQHAFHLTAKMDRVQTLLNLAGRPDLQVPEGLAGAKVAVDVPRGVRAMYGNCPKRGMPAPEGTNWGDCLILMQLPVPTVVTIPELNLSAIAQLGLELSGMTPEQAAAFSRTVDWTSTLAIPLPREAGDYQTVQVDGVEGVLITQRARNGRPPGYALIWIKNGFVYSLGGFGNPGLAVPLAESLG